MDALRVLADDLTGACDVGAEFLPGPGGVVVQPALETGGPAPRGTMCVRNTQSRTLGPADAARRVAAALADVGPGWAGLVLKKIDTGLRGPLGAEIDATMDALGVEEAFVLPAIPEVGRTTLGGRQMIGGVPVNETAFACDPHHPIHDASVPAALAATGRRQAAVIDIAAVRGDLTAAIERARAAGAGVLACDAETRRQLERAARRGLVRPIEVPSLAGADWAGAQAARALASGTVPALVAPATASPEGSAAVLAALRRAALSTLARVRPGGLVLVGGETAYHVLEGLGLPPLWLESRLCPLVVRARLMAGAYAGLAVVTKGGSTGAPDLLAAIVRQLARGAR